MIAAALAFALLVTAVPDGASEPTGTAESGAAGESRTTNDLLARAARAYNENRLDEALVLLERAYAREPRVSLLFSMAQIQRARHDCAAAGALYDRFLAEAGKDNHDRERAERRRVEMQACVEKARGEGGAEGVPEAHAPSTGAPGAGSASGAPVGATSARTADAAGGLRKASSQPTPPLTARDSGPSTAARIDVDVTSRTPARSRTRLAAWVLGGAAVAATVACGYLAWRAYADGDLGGLTFRSSPYDDRVAAGQRAARASRWVGAAAVLTAAGAGTLFFLSRSSVAVSARPGDVAAVWSTTF